MKKLKRPGKGWKRVDGGWMSKDRKEIRTDWMTFDPQPKPFPKPRIVKADSKISPRPKKRISKHFCEACEL